MRKKYLLYIHEEQFDTEPEKSKLVNSLLRQHYAGGRVKSVSPPVIEHPSLTNEAMIRFMESH